MDKILEKTYSGNTCKFSCDLGQIALAQHTKLDYKSFTNTSQTILDALNSVQTNDSDKWNLEYYVNKNNIIVGTGSLAELDVDHPGIMKKVIAETAGTYDTKEFTEDIYNSVAVNRGYISANLEPINARKNTTYIRVHPIGGWNKIFNLMFSKIEYHGDISKDEFNAMVKSFPIKTRALGIDWPITFDDRYFINNKMVSLWY